MSRLTMTSPQGGVALTFDLDVTCEISEMRKLLKVFQKLKEYEELEEQGLILKLPCKVGDTVYQITRDFVSEYKIRNFICYDNGNIFFDWKCIKGIYKNVRGFHIDDIGKTVFLTKEEAEKELKRLEGAE